MERGRLPLVDGGQELAAVGEVLVHEGPADSRALGHGLHGDRLHVAGGDEGGGRVEQPVPPVGPGQAQRLDVVGRHDRCAPCTDRSHGVILSQRG